MRKIEVALNTCELTKYSISRPPRIKTVVAAPMERDDCTTTYHRATVEEYTMETVYVFFIDHGRTSRVRIDDLGMIDINIAKLPCLAFRCALAHIRPSNEADNCRGRWSKVARDCFKAHIHESETIFGNIYSVAHSTVNLELIVIDKKDKQLIMNDYLVEKGHAISRNESFLSKYNHDLRADLDIVNAMSPEEKSFYEERQYSEDNLLEVR